jgi:putative endonuclease
MDDRARKAVGAAAEDAALKHLTANGLQLIARNYRCRGGELDLVMLEGKTLALIEVRYRSSDDFGGAAASVTWFKQRRLMLAARHLITTRNDLRRYPARFDVIAVTGFNWKLPQIEWIKGAFLMDR